MNNILELSDNNKVTGEIYLITNTEANMMYVGQTRSHRINRGKYRPFGTIGRFKEHISEAINNTKRNQCCYLNNAIRKYGSAKFEVKLLETCALAVLNDREMFYISQHNTVYPNGYNLTPGGRFLSKIKIENPCELLDPKKRGRPFGYKHKQETIVKMKNYLSDSKILDSKRSKMAETMSSFYDKKKIKILSTIVLGSDVKEYIKPVYQKNTNIVHDYIIRIGKRKLTLRTQNTTLEEKYKRLLDVLTMVKTEQVKNEEAKVKIVEM